MWLIDACCGYNMVISCNFTRCIKHYCLLFSEHVHVTNIPPESVQAHACKVCHFHLKHVTLEQIKCVKVIFLSTCATSACVSLSTSKNCRTLFSK